MTEDKLEHDERLRLEALGQSVAAFGLRGAAPEQIVAAARTFEDYVRGEHRGGRGAG